MIKMLQQRLVKYTAFLVMVIVILVVATRQESVRAETEQRFPSGSSTLDSEARDAVLDTIFAGFLDSITEDTEKEKQGTTGTDSTNTGTDSTNTGTDSTNTGTDSTNTGTEKKLIDNCVLVPYTKQDGGVYLMNDCLRPKNAPDPIGKDAYTADPSGAGGVRTLLALTTGGIIAIGGVVAILAVIYSGFLMVTSGGDEGKREEAIKYLTWSIVGLLIMIFSYIIVKNIIDVIGIAATFMPG